MANNTNMYPSTDELIPDVLKAKLPVSLYEDLCNRYEVLGSKYLSGNRTTDGRYINDMMYTSRISNGLEEVVDAVFCILGWRFKCKVKDIEFPITGEIVLGSLITVYSDLMEEKLNGTYS